MGNSLPDSTYQLTNSPSYQFQSVILFDGVCNLCNSFVQFVIARDPLGRFQFAPLQSGAAARLLGARDTHDERPDSMFLVQDGRVFTRSAAALRILRGLRFPWPLAFACIAVPRPLRDWAYDMVARHRDQWFGRRDVCMVPTPDLRARFLDD
jgi:predicted DCC family thiol-disulfide oxidoreductase YuxK